MNENKLGVQFGKRLRALRNEHGLVQEDIGGWFNMRKSTVSQWESGRMPHPAIITELARRFQVSADYLLGLSDIRLPADTFLTKCAEQPAEYLPSEALERIEEFKELMRLKYNHKK
jgi:Predicted transcriptional regulators